jgi:hypothetical protein
MLRSSLPSGVGLGQPVSVSSMEVLSPNVWSGLALMSSTHLAPMWLSALVVELLLVQVLGLALVLIGASIQAAAVGAPPASVVHLSVSRLRVSRPPSQHPR